MSKAAGSVSGGSPAGASARVAMISRSPEQIDQYTSALNSMFRIEGYTDVSSALAVLVRNPPSAIVDVFAALTERRAYRSGMPAENALALMMSPMSAELDQQLLHRFRERLLDAVGG